MNINRLVYVTISAIFCFALYACGGGSNGGSGNGSGNGSGSGSGSGSGGSGTLSVSTSKPANGAIDVSVSPTFELVFSAPVINVNSTNVVLHDGSANGEVVPISPITPGANNTYSFSPTSPLKFSWVYCLVLSDGITSTDGLKKLAQSTICFTTVARSSATQQVGAPGGSTIGYGIAVDPNGTSFVTGETIVAIAPGATQAGNVDYFVAKYSSARELVWTRQVGAAGGTTIGKGIAEDSNGNSYVVGLTKGAGISGNTLQGGSDYFIAKYDPNGVLLWTQEAGAGGTVGTSISVDSSGNSYITGSTSGALSGQTLNGAGDYFVAKYDTNGQFQWSKQFGSPNLSAQGNGISLDSTGNIYVAGYSQVAFVNPTIFYFITKLNSNGEIQWTRKNGSLGGNATGEDIAIDASGNAYIAGSTNVGLSGTGGQKGIYDLFIAKYNPAGDLLWIRENGFADRRTFGNAISVDSSGTSFVAGATEQSFSGSQLGLTDYFIASFDSDGNTVSTKQVGVADKSTYAADIGIDKDDHTYVTGYTTGALSGSGPYGAVDYFIQFD